MKKKLLFVLAITLLCLPIFAQAEEPEGCRATAKNCTDQEYDDGDGAKFGGEAALGTGNWLHEQKEGPSGSFLFDCHKANSPAGSEITDIRCSDPGECAPSGDPPSPAKQLDFDGVGTFKNFGKKGLDPVWLSVPGGANAKLNPKGKDEKDFGGTFHYFQVNIDDLGEPGNKYLDAETDPDTCPPNGFGEKGDLPFGNCDCADFYQITIYNGADAADVEWIDGNINPSSLNQVDVIYEFHGYIDGGNLQIHRLTGYDTNLTYDGLVDMRMLATKWLEPISVW